MALKDDCYKFTDFCSLLQAWFRGIRPSKYRHVYGKPSKKEACYTDITVARSGNEGNLCAVNPCFLAIVSESAFVVIPLKQTGRIDFQCCKVIGHNGTVTDLKWNPFNDNIIASGSDDCNVSNGIDNISLPCIVTN